MTYGGCPPSRVLSPPCSFALCMEFPQSVCRLGGDPQEEPVIPRGRCASVLGSQGCLLPGKVLEFSHLLQALRHVVFVSGEVGGRIMWTTEPQSLP